MHHCFTAFLSKNACLYKITINSNVELNKKKTDMHSLNFLLQLHLQHFIRQITEINQITSIFK